MVKTKFFAEFFLLQRFHQLTREIHRLKYNFREEHISAINVEEKLNKKVNSNTQSFLNNAYHYWEGGYYFLTLLKDLENCVVAKIIYLLKQAVKHTYSQLKSILKSDS